MSRLPWWFLFTQPRPQALSSPRLQANLGTRLIYSCFYSVWWIGDLDSVFDQFYTGPERSLTCFIPVQPVYTETRPSGGGGGGGGIPDFKWPGWPKDSCVGLKFSISGFFWVGKFWQVFFWKPAPVQIVAILSVRRVTRLQAFTTQTVQKRARFRCLHESA